MSSRAATPSSVDAAWSVQAASSSTLRSAIWGSSRRMANHTRTPHSGNRNAAGHHVMPATIHSGPADRVVRIAIHTPQRISWPTSQVSSSMRSSTSPTACSDSSESGCAIAASIRSARSWPSARSTTTPQMVRAAVSTNAPPTTASASRVTSIWVGESARRPAATLPSEEAIAATRAITRATTVRGRRTRRQSTGWRSAGSSDTGVVASAEREASMVVTVTSG